MRVLITNWMLVGRSGTETFVRDLALGLLRTGHAPAVFSPRLGPIAAEIHAAGIPVGDDLSALAEPPDVIHGHHNLATVIALLHLPRTPAVFVCHDALAWHDAAPAHPRVLRAVGVDENCRERLAREGAIDPARLRVISNAVDLERFRPRGPLAPRPRRALLFSNYANRLTLLAPVEEACARLGIELDVIGAGVSNVCDRPEDVLGRYDLVFAKARCALEAMATGAAVVLCGDSGVGPLVTSDRVAELHRWNFGRRVLGEPLTPEALVEAARRYDPDDAARVRSYIRTHAGLDEAVRSWLSLYGEVCGEATAPDAAAEARAVAGFLRLVEPPLFRAFELEDRARHLEAEVGRLDRERHELAMRLGDEARSA